MGKFLLKWTAAALMVWLSAAASCALYDACLRAPVVTRPVWAFLIGVGAYLVVQFFLFRPLLSHVLAHELTHAIVAVLLGGRVTAIHATTSGGSTTVNRSGVLISLAPYVFPFYAVLLTPVYFIAAESFKLPLAGLLGFTWTYHVALTVYTLFHNQPDLKEGGTVFSLIFIICGNIIVLLILTVLLWPEALTWKSVFWGIGHWAVRLAEAVFQALRPLFTHQEAPS